MPWSEGSEERLVEPRGDGSDGLLENPVVEEDVPQASVREVRLVVLVRPDNHFVRVHDTVEVAVRGRHGNGQRITRLDRVGPRLDAVSVHDAEEANLADLVVGNARVEDHAEDATAMDRRSIGDVR